MNSVTWFVRTGLLVAMVFGCSLANGQSAPRVRSIGPLLASSSEPFSSVSQVRALPGGRILVEDILSRRVVMLDSTLQRVTVVVDSIPQFGALITYLGDTTLAVNPAQVSMLVIDPTGKVVRTMAIPDPRNMLGFIGGPYGSPGLDARGRLIYAAMPPRPTRPMPEGSPPLPDSAPILRFDLNTRTRDTIAVLRVPPARFALQTLRAGKDTSSRLWRALDPIPTTDDWAVLSDGTIAIIHGGEYRVDLIDANGGVTKGPKVPFDWQRLSTEDKAAVLDSTRDAMVQRETAAIAARAAAAKSDSATKGTQRPSAPDNFAVTVSYPLVTVDQMPDYRPAFELGAAHGDAEGNLWIRTSKFVAGGAVYDVIDRRGILIDRVAVPQGRVIAGFGPGGTVYLGVLVDGKARVERARAR